MSWVLKAHTRGSPDAGRILVWAGSEPMNERKPVGQENAMEAAATRKKATSKPAKLGRDVQARLGQQLRSMYDEVVSQGVPDRFTDLLNRLDNNGSKDGH